MTQQEMLDTVNVRINELIAAGAKKELILKGLSESEINDELCKAAVSSLLGF